MKNFFANFIMSVLYYVFVGFGSVFNKIFGINPFKKKTEGDSYWISRSKEATLFQVTEPGTVPSQSNGGQN